MPTDFNRQIIEEYRANEGEVGGPFEGARLLLLTTICVKSGKQHTTPLGYLPDGERLLIIASANGAPNHPAWFHNLVANPRVTIEAGAFSYEAEAVVLEGEERDRIFARAVEADPGWGEYQAKTTRVIPVVALRPIPGVPPKASSLGAALKLIHDAFRRELALIRKEIAESGPGLGTQLRINCLTVCQGLHHHHTMEDAGMFSQLDQHHPELAHTMERLRQEHETIAILLDELRTLVSSEDVEQAVALAEVERLTAELEAHLGYEEDQLIPILDAMGR